MKLRVVLYCLLGGLPMLIAAMGMGSPLRAWVAGVVMAAGFVPLAVFGPRGFWGQLVIVFPVLLIITCVCTWSEAFLFMPSALGEHPLTALIGSMVMYAILAIILALLAGWLKVTRDGSPSIAHRGPMAAVLMVLLSGAAYAFYYLITGAITYKFFTHGYYPEAEQMAQRMGLWFWAIQIGRGTIMTLGVLPAIYTLRMSRWQAAIAVGLLVWVAGGLAPLLLPGIGMGTAQRFIHIVEIFTQNFPLGMTAALLLRPKAVIVLPPKAAVSAA